MSGVSDGVDAGAAGVSAGAAGVGAADADDATSVPVIVTTKNVTASEVAAVSAVIRGLLAEEGDALREETTYGPSAWQRSQRSLRGAVEPGPGRWNH